MLKFNSLYLLIFLIFAGCNSLKDAGKVLRNEKIKTTDEFLVEKKGALSEPPDYSKLPLPNSKESKENKIKTIMQKQEENSVVTNSQKGTLEEKILNQIRE
mgnify:CR=1 FL=1